MIWLENEPGTNRPTPTVQYHKKRDGILRIDPNGTCRFLTLWERFLYFLGSRP
jgi:hypothetical protein